MAHRDGLKNANTHGVPEQFLLHIQRQQTLLDAELGWMDSLLTRLEAGAIPWGAAGCDNSDRYLAQRKAAQQ